MKSIFLFFCATTLSLFAFGDGKAVGQWEGILNAGSQKFNLVAEFAEMDGKTVGIFYSVDQSSEGMAMTSVSAKGNNINFVIKSINAAFKGKMKNDDEISGTFEQNGMKFLLTFKRNATPKSIEPKAIKIPADLLSEIRGEWKGVLNVNGSTMLNLEITFESTDSAFLVSPDQSPAKIPFTKFESNGKSLKIAASQIGASMDLKIKNGRLDGTFYQGKLKQDIVFTKK